MQQYVCGFLVSPDRSRVLLIRKNRPAWQKGRLNGVGGKLEAGETPFQAMVREFREEAGLTVESWRHGVTLTGVPTEADPKGWQGHFFIAVATAEQFSSWRSLTDEQLEVHTLASLPRGESGVIPNLHWLIPLLLDDEASHFRKYTVTVAPK